MAENFGWIEMVVFGGIALGIGSALTIARIAGWPSVVSIETILIAVGVSGMIGVFFGFLIPLAQIPVSAAFAVALRANVPTAVAMLD